MRLTARPLVVAAVLSVGLLSMAGCSWDDLKGQSSTSEAPVPAGKTEDATSRSANEPAAAQEPRPGSEPLFHATSLSDQKRHEFATSGGFTVRFACKGAGTAVVSLGAAKYTYTCTPDAAEQRSELRVKKPGPQTYRVEVTTSNAKNTWSLFLDRMRTR
jgi:hypothetical protein